MQLWKIISINCVLHIRKWLNIRLKTAQCVKILNSESFQLQLSIRQSFGTLWLQTEGNKVTLIVCLLQIIDRKQNNLTAITEFGVAVTTSDIPNDFSNIAGVFNIGYSKLWIRFSSPYPKTTLKHCQKNER